LSKDLNVLELFEFYFSNHNLLIENTKNLIKGCETLPNFYNKVCETRQKLILRGTKLFFYFPECKTMHNLEGHKTMSNF